MPHFPWLGHADHTIVDGGVPVGMVVTHNVTDGLGRFAVRLVRGITGVVHGVQNPALHGLQPVPYIGDCPVLNNIFGIPAKAVTDDLFQKSRQKLF
ncbi:hypothetical protein D3C81_1841760 [compost metagenome]